MHRKCKFQTANSNCILELYCPSNSVLAMLLIDAGTLTVKLYLSSTKLLLKLMEMVNYLIDWACPLIAVDVAVEGEIDLVLLPELL